MLYWFFEIHTIEVSMQKLLFSVLLCTATMVTAQDATQKYPLPAYKPKSSVSTPVAPDGASPMDAPASTNIATAHGLQASSLKAGTSFAAEPAVVTPASPVELNGLSLSLSRDLDVVAHPGRHHGTHGVGPHATLPVGAVFANGRPHHRPVPKKTVPVKKPVPAPTPVVSKPMIAPVLTATSKPPPTEPPHGLSMPASMPVASQPASAQIQALAVNQTISQTAPVPSSPSRTVSILTDSIWDGAGNPNQAVQSSLTSMLKAMNSGGTTPKRIRVTGYTDQQVPSTGAMAIAKDQTAKFANLLMDMGIPFESLEAYAKGNKAPKLDCLSIPAANQKSCHFQNRRIEIEFFN